MRRRSVLHLVRAIALGVIGLAVVTGCSGFRGGTVAYVGNSSITQAQLDSAVGGVQETLEEGQNVAADAVVNVLIHGDIAEQIAATRKITVTDAQRDKLLATSNLASLLQVPAAKVVAYDVATQQIVATSIGARAYLDEMAKIPVTLNPRFGVLNTTEKTIIDGLSSSLSQPA
jgi:hypothetical protein